MDLCGTSVAIAGNTAIVGCPNRDESLSPNSNTGAAFAYDLSLLNFQFSSYVIVREGQTAEVSVLRRASSPENTTASFYLQTTDSVLNDDDHLQSLLKNMYGIRDQDILYPATIAETSGCTGDARGRKGILSDWLGGTYDYKGWSDFEMIKLPVRFLPTQTLASISVSTNDDTILELPNENFTAVAFLPGSWASTVGKLRSVVTILDNDNGYFNDTSTTSFDKLSTAALSAAGVGSSVSVLMSDSLMVTGLPLLAVDSIDSAGQVLVYKNILGRWLQVESLLSLNPSNNGQFGHSVNLLARVGENATVLAVGEPGQNRVHILVSIDQGLSWTLEATLTSVDAYLPQDNFGRSGTIAIGHNVVVVGCPLLEAAYLFYRLINSTTLSYFWDSPVTLRASDYDYDVIFSVNISHPQHFGHSVALSSRTLVVGSPYGDYSDPPEVLVGLNFNSAGRSMESVARGKVYVFYSQPSVQLITLVSLIPLRRGTFQLSLSYHGMVSVSPEINFNDTADTLVAKLEALANTGSVEATADYIEVVANETSSIFTYSWEVTFSQEWEEVPLLMPLYLGNGCFNCTAFDGLYNQTLVDGPMITVISVSVYAPLQETSTLVANDRRSGDRFGSSLAIDGDYIAVGAVSSSTSTTSTWNFEDGDLRGWFATGTAFQYQPTFGDNTYLRPIYAASSKRIPVGAGQHSNLVGRYFIGTFDKRPGSSDDFRVPDLSYPQGNAQGDLPMGTLTSQTFSIRGRRITLLIGGGCDVYHTYVELLVDGQGVARLSGACSETMTRMGFNVTAYANRVGQLRIVDASSQKWGHINVDDIRFDWDVNGGLLNDNFQASQPSYGGQTESPLSGAVYMFRRLAINGTGIQAACLTMKGTTCLWVQESRFTASDKRNGSFFGTSLSLNAETGMLVVSAPFASQTGLFNEFPAQFPAANTTIVEFPINPDSILRIPFESFSSGSFYDFQLENDRRDQYSLTRNGAIYIFIRTQASLGTQGRVGTPEYWYPTEFAHFQPSDASAGDEFGHALALDGHQLFVGAPGQKSNGAVYLIDLSVAAISFTQVYIDHRFFHFIRSQRLTCLLYRSFFGHTKDVMSSQKVPIFIEDKLIIIQYILTYNLYHSDCGAEQ